MWFFFCQRVTDPSFTLVRMSKIFFINLKHFRKQNYACLMSNAVVVTYFIGQSIVIEIY